jgi:succinate dehydrogenase / fumarate reductase cytochrome b subunit
MNQNRPISPHLTIYKPQISSVLSIYHRMTGLLLVATLSMFLFMTKVATLHVRIYSLYYISYYVNSLSHWIMISLLFGLLITFYYHFYNGIRHLIWDNGWGFELKIFHLSGYAVILLTLLSTITTWIILYS